MGKFHDIGKRRNGASGAQTPSDRPTINISDEQAEAIRQADLAFGAAKVALADAFVASRAAGEKVTAAYDAVKAASEAFIGQIQDVARAHDIDPDDPAKGRWNFNAQTFQFTRLA